jgi:hypothetical protein
MFIKQLNQHTAQRRKFRRDLARAGVAYPPAAEEAPEGRLFSDRKATRAILAFIATTEVGLRGGEAEREAEQARRDDEWDLEALDPAEREGEG